MSEDDVAIPAKTYFKIGEVAKLTGLEPHVLRYWETEFRQISPEKSRSGQRLYRREHIERVLEVKDLLYRQKYTVAGARRRLLHRHDQDEAEAAITQERKRYQDALKQRQGDLNETLRHIRNQLLDFRRRLHNG